MSIVTVSPEDRKKYVTNPNNFYVFQEEDQFLLPKDPFLPYRRHVNSKNPSWGQLKLCLSVIQFLNYYYDKSKHPNLKFVYVGMAPGINMNFVAKLFPEVEFHGYDGRDILAVGKNIKTYKQFFTADDAAKWAEVIRRGENVMLYSDIRSVDINTNDELKIEQEVLKDMDMQLEWYAIMKPIAAMLKWRLPYPDKGIKQNFYLSYPGKIFKGIYSPSASTETRFVPEGYDKTYRYDIVKYQNQLFYHNTVVRKLNFLIPDPDPVQARLSYNSEFVNTYDSVSEMVILLQYLTKQNLPSNLHNAYNLHKLFVKTIGENRPPETWITIQKLRDEPYLLKKKYFKKGLDISYTELDPSLLEDFLNLWYQHKVSRLISEKILESLDSPDKKLKYTIRDILEKWLLGMMACDECISSTNWQNIYSYFQTSPDIESSLEELLTPLIKNKKTDINTIMRQIRHIVGQVGNKQQPRRVMIVQIPEVYNYQKNSLKKEEVENTIFVGVYQDLVQVLDGETPFNLYYTPILKSLISKHGLIPVLMNMLKYEGLMAGKNRLALYPTMWEKLQKLGFQNEAFSTPFNSRLICVPDDGRFCALYDKENPEIGSSGDFFNVKFEQYSGKWVIFPPLTEKIVDDTISFVMMNAQFIMGSLLIVPVWDQIPNIQYLKNTVPYQLIQSHKIQVLNFKGESIPLPQDFYVFYLVTPDFIQNNPISSQVLDWMKNLEMEGAIVPKLKIGETGGEEEREERPFPYKRSFMNPTELWTKLYSTEYSILNKIGRMVKMSAIPDDYNYFVNSAGVHDHYVISTRDDAYEVNTLSDLFSEEARMQACRRGKISPYEFYQQNYADILRDAQRMMETERKKEEKQEGRILRDLNYYLRETLYAKASKLECSNFKPSVVKLVAQLFKARSVIDMSAGWGDRILGFAAAGTQRYIGVDPNEALRQSYANIISFLKEQDRVNNVKQAPKADFNQYQIISDSFLEPSLILPANSFDMAFTSPPFYDYEIYNQDINDPKQSIFKKKTVEEWLQDFLYPYLKKAWDALVVGGTMAIYISDPGRSGFIEKMLEYVETALQAKYIGVLPVARGHDVTNVKNLESAYPIWCWKKMAA